jgi:hypothetical protein
MFSSKYDKIDMLEFLNSIKRENVLSSFLVLQLYTAISKLDSYILKLDLEIPKIEN